MMERLYVLEEADTQEFVGVNRANLVTLQNLFPKTKLRIHQNVIKVLGEDQAAEELLHIPLLSGSPVQSPQPADRSTDHRGRASAPQ